MYMCVKVEVFNTNISYWHKYGKNRTNMIATDQYLEYCPYDTVL